MNKNKFLYALVALGMLLFSGCEDLDTFPEGSTQTSDQVLEVVENNPIRSEASVNAIFASFNLYNPNESQIGARHNDFGYPSLMMFFDHNGLDLVSTDVGYNWNGNNLDYTDRLVTSNETQILWNDMYTTIKACNTVIASIDAETTDPTSQYYLAQGLATRAFSYWVLAQTYQFNYVGNESKLCVPLLTQENIEESAKSGVPRSTVADTYALINSDLTSAISLLSSALTAGIERPDKRYIDLAVAYGLSARVNLTMQNWTEAVIAADNAIAKSDAVPSSLEEASNPSFWSADESNWMWGIIVAETDAVVNSGIVNFPSHMGSFNYGYANFSGGKQINKALYEAIPSDDIRKGWWLNAGKLSDNLSKEEAETIDGYGYVAYTQVKFGPYKNEMKTSTNASDIPLMRIEEMYLIKAEAEAMSGADGKSTLETFVTSYRNPSYSCPASDAVSIQNEVYFQRRIELWGEGLNWFDIMRLGKDVDRRGGNFQASMVFNIPAGSDILLWRIPETEIEANPALETEDNNPSSSIPEPVADIE